MRGNSPLRIELMQVKDVPLILPAGAPERARVSRGAARPGWPRWLLGVPPLVVMFYLLLVS